ncbi:MAG: hypothetical protein RLZZ396_1389, partial [Planctomycetota bacterium]
KFVGPSKTGTYRLVGGLVSQGVKQQQVHLLHLFVLVPVVFAIACRCGIFGERKKDIKP